MARFGALALHLPPRRESKRLANKQDEAGQRPRETRLKLYEAKQPYRDKPLSEVSSSK
jgi:hypothetical protein